MSRFWSYDTADGHQWHDTPEAARAAAQRALDDERDLCQREGEWSDEVESICWGEVRERATEHSREEHHAECAGECHDECEIYGSGADYVVAYDLRPVVLDDASVLIRPDEPAAVRDVLAERAKQALRWGDAHDDERADGALAAAAAYLLYPFEIVPPAPEWAAVLRAKHASDRRRQLVIGAALALAEIERLDRKCPGCPSPKDGPHKMSCAVTKDRITVAVSKRESDMDVLALAADRLDAMRERE